MKICNKCDTEKTLDCFQKRPTSTDGYRSYCKDCKSEQDKASRIQRLSKPGGKEKEKQQGRDRLLKKSAEEMVLVKEAWLENCRKNRQIKKDEFFDKHGCTLQEFKWKQDGVKFVEDSLKRNGSKYNYSRVVYRGVWALVDIFCNKHQSYFQQSPKSHGVGSGCPDCASQAKGDALRKSQEDFLAEAKIACGDICTFELVRYVNSHTHVFITCNTHGPFKITPGSLLSAGNGCPMCSVGGGYSKDKPGSIYVLTNGEITKIGITNRAVEQRLKEINKDKPGFSILYQEQFEDGRMAYSIEWATKMYLKSIHKSPEDKFDGYTECFYNVNNAALLNIIKQHVINIEGMYDNHRSSFELGPPPPPSFGFWGFAPLAGLSLLADS